MNWNRPFTPSFLKKYDEYLLKNNPAIWSFRTHLVAYYSLAFTLLLAILCYIAPYDLRNDNNTDSWVFATIVLCCLGCIVWFIYLLRFNVFKRFGKINTSNYSIKSYFHYAICILCMSVPAFVPDAIETLRAKQKYSLAELQHDAFAMNENLCYIHKDSLLEDWDKKYITIINDVNSKVFFDSLFSYTIQNKQFIKIDTNYFVMKDNESTAESHEYYLYAGIYDSVAKNYDSVKSITEHNKIFAINPGFTFVTVGGYIRDYTYNEYSIEHYNKHDDRNDDSVLFRTIIQNPQKRTDLNTVALVKYFGKYLTSKDYRKIENEKLDDLQNISREEKSYNDESSKYNSNFYFINKKYYEVSHVKDNLENITDKLTRYNNNVSAAIHALICFVLLLALVIFIFRNTSIKVFFLSILSGILLLISMGFCAGIFRFSESLLFAQGYLYIALVCIIALQIFFAKTQKNIHGIALNLMICVAPFIPLIIFATIMEYMQNNVKFDREYYEFKNYGIYASMYLGILILFTFIPTLFAKLYRKWNSLPEE